MERGKTRAVTGVSKMHVAQLLVDSTSELVYDTMQEVPNTINVTATPNQNNETLYADNKAVINYSVLGDVGVSWEHINFDTEILEYLLDMPKQGAVVHTTSGTAVPKIGIAYEINYDDGSKKYVKIYKVTFNTPELGANTEEDSPNYQTREISGMGVTTSYTFIDHKGREVGLTMAEVDTTHPDYAGEGATWFDSMFTTPSALAVTSNVNDGDTGVAVNTVLTLTSNNELVESYVENPLNVFLSEDGVGLVAGVLALDATNKILTFTPDADLSATANYTFVYNVKDVYNQTVNEVVNFTTV